MCYLIYLSRVYLLFFFFFKQKTAYEMRISDWSSDVCSSDLTYAEVPYESAWQSLTGHSFNAMFGWERNNFDRIVHFSYGFLLAYPLREIFLRVAEIGRAHV